MKQKKEEYIKKATLSFSKFVHSRILVANPDLGTATDFLTINTEALYEIAHRDYNGSKPLVSKTMFLNNIMDYDVKLKMAKNLGKVVIYEHDVYKSIVKQMKSEILELDKIMNDRSSIDYQLPVIKVTEELLVEEDFSDYYKREFDEFDYSSYGRRFMENVGTIQDSKLNIKRLGDFDITKKLLSLDVVDTPASTKFINGLGNVFLLTTMNKFLKGVKYVDEEFTMKEAMTYQLLLLILRDSDVSEAVLNAHIAHSTYILEKAKLLLASAQDLVVLKKWVKDTPYIICHRDNLAKFTKNYSIDVIMGEMLMNKVEPVTTDKLLARSSLYTDAYNNYIKRKETEHINKIERIVLEAVEGMYDFQSRMTDDMIKRLSPAIESISNSPKDLKLGIIRAVRGLEPNEMRSSSDVIEAIFVKVLFQDTDFATFYRRADQDGKDNLSVGISTALYLMICKAIFKLL